jgi:hypothetical protein
MSYRVDAAMDDVEHSRGDAPVDFVPCVAEPQQLAARYSAVLPMREFGNRTIDPILRTFARYRRAKVRGACHGGHLRGPAATRGLRVLLQRTEASANRNQVRRATNSAL